VLKKKKQHLKEMLRQIDSISRCLIH